MRMEVVSSDLKSLWKLEKIQRSRDRKILESDRNTTYFQAMANQRNRKKRILALRAQRGGLMIMNPCLSMHYLFIRVCSEKKKRAVWS
jgi:hypothetical protein